MILNLRTLVTLLRIWSFYIFNIRNGSVDGEGYGEGVRENKHLDRATANSGLWGRREGERGQGRERVKACDSHSRARALSLSLPAYLMV